MPIPPCRLGPEEQIALLDVFRRTGDIGAAARVAGTTTAAVRERARRDQAFAEALQTARDDYRDEVVIPEAQRRAVQGTLEPVYYRGQRAQEPDGTPAAVRKYSDAIMLRLLEVLDPRFRPRSVHEVRPAQVEPQDLDALSPEARAKLDELVRILQAASPQALLSEGVDPELEPLDIPLEAQGPDESL
jgi:hypothetical protein